MSRVRVAVLELTSALHNWRTDPSPENVEALTVAAWSVSGHALELERQVQILVEGEKEAHDHG